MRYEALSSGDMGEVIAEGGVLAYYETPIDYYVVDYKVYRVGDVVRWVGFFGEDGDEIALIPVNGLPDNLTLNAMATALAYAGHRQVFGLPATESLRREDFMGE